MESINIEGLIFNRKQRNIYKKNTTVDNQVTMQDIKIFKLFFTRECAIYIVSMSKLFESGTWLSFNEKEKNMDYDSANCSSLDRF